MPAIHIKGGDAPGRKTFAVKGEKHGRMLEFYPERGMITMRIETVQGGAHSEKYHRVSLSDFLARIDALRLNVLQSRRHAAVDSSRGKRHHQDALRLQRIVDCMVACYKAATEQGDPIARLLAQSMNRSAIKNPTYETPVGALPTAPSDRPYAPTVVADDPRRALILPAGMRHGGVQ